MAPCTIRWCGKNSHNSNIQKNGISFHRYPKDPNIKNKWIAITRRENWVPSEHSVICSRHFTEDCFIYMKNRRRLLGSAVPTLNLPLLSNAVDSVTSTPSTSKDESLIKSSSECISHSPKVKEINSSPQTPTTKHNKRFSGNPSDYTTPTKKLMCRRITELSDKIILKNKKIKNLSAKTRYMRKRIVSLKKILNELENKQLIDSCNADLLN